VHDADFDGVWIEQGFHVIEPPTDVPTDEAVLLLAWGELPTDIHTLLRAHGLSWNRNRHRGFVKERA